jgi:spore germination protein KC
MERGNMKKIAAIISVLLIIPLLTGCWDYREVDKMAIVVGFAVDKGTEHEYRVTYEIVDLSQMQAEGTVKSVIVESEGDTFLEAARNAISKNFPRLYSGHTVCIIISKEIASEGILELVDYICRDAETRLSIHLFVSREETAGELLQVKPLGSELLSVEINSILMEQKHLAKAIALQTYEFINCVLCEGKSCVMTALCIEKNAEEEVVKICGSGIFKEEKLLGFIGEEETKALSFILDKVEGGVIVAKTGSGEDEDRFSLEILSNSTKIKPVLKDEKLSIEIDVETEVRLDEHFSKEDFENEKGLEELSKIAEEQMKTEMETLINQIKTEFGSDVFGFGNCVYRDYPEQWKKIKDNWDEEFKNIEVKIKPKIKILNSGTLKKSPLR